VTSRAEILSAARRLIARDGADRLTLRRLSTEMGIGTTTLYHHVRGREDLLVLLLDEMLRAAPQPELPPEPRERIVVTTVAIRDALAACPWVAEVLTTDGFLGLLDDESVRMVEVILTAAAEEGCTPEAAVDLFRNLWYFAVGEILIRARSRSTTPEERAQRPGFASRNPDLLPHLAAIGPRWPAIADRDTFESGVRAFVNGMLG